MNLTTFAVPFVAFALAGCMSDQGTVNSDNPADRTAGDSSSVTPQTSDTMRSSKDTNNLSSPPHNQAPRDNPVPGR